VAVEGVSVAPLTAGIRARYSIPDSVTGVVIVDVSRGTEAAELGLQPGFVITRADTRAVTTPEEFRSAVAAVKAAGRPGVLLFVRTPQGNATVVLKFEADD
jgi:serine protease Do